MIRTRVGYTGGITPDPTYRRIGDHSETIQIDYDPTIISYEELLDVFWNAHNPTRSNLSTQYKSAIFYHDETQRKLAEASKAQEQAKQGRTIYTEIDALRTFYLAEDYHQKYYLRGRKDLVREFKAIYPDLGDFINSTAVTRANAYVGRNGTWQMLQHEIDSLGLSTEAQGRLVEIFDPTKELTDVNCPVPELTG